MRSQHLSLFGLVAGANAHGYLSSPMSRTGLNAQVSILLIPIPTDPRIEFAILTRNSQE